MQVREPRLPRRRFERRTVEQVVAGRAFCLLPEPGRCVGLRIEIDDERRRPASARNQAARLTAVVVLPTPPFWLASAKMLPTARGYSG